MKQKGFGVVELMITLAIVGAGFVIVARAYNISTRLSKQARDTMLANGAAYAQLQKYENKNFADIPSTPVPAEGETPASIYEFTGELPAQLQSPKTGYVYVLSMSATLKYIFVRINYQSNGNQRTLEYGSLIQAGGLGR